MALSNKLVSKFVKATKNDTTNTKKEKIVYGKIVKGVNVGTPDAVYYAQIDGADENTLIPITSFMENVDVTKKLVITIKDHNAIVTGSIDINEVPVTVGKQIEEAIADMEPTSSIAIADIKALWQ